MVKTSDPEQVRSTRKHDSVRRDDIKHKVIPCIRAWFEEELKDILHWTNCECEATVDSFKVFLLCIISIF